MMNMIPPPHILTYATVLARASSGAFIRRAIGSANAIRTKVRITPAIRKKSIALPIVFPALSMFLLPMNVPRRTVMPVARPVITKVTRLMMLLPVDTPERPSVVPNHPTISTSTAPYAAWSTREPRIGIMNFMSFPVIRPSVKSETVFSMRAIIQHGVDLI